MPPLDSPPPGLGNTVSPLKIPVLTSTSLSRPRPLSYCIANTCSDVAATFVVVMSLKPYMPPSLPTREFLSLECVTGRATTLPPVSAGVSALASWTTHEWTCWPRSSHSTSSSLRKTKYVYWSTVEMWMEWYPILVGGGVNDCTRTLYHSC